MKFRLFKNAAALKRTAGGDSPMKTDQKKVRKSMFRDVLLPDVSREFPLEQMPDRFVPAPAHEGLDGLGREYSDEVFQTLSGKNRTAYPDEVKEIDDTGDIPIPGPAFTRGGGGELSHRPVGADYVDNEVGPQRVGDMMLMRPGNSGIADAAEFKPTGASDVAKREPGMFRSLIEAREGEPSNYFSAPRVAKSARAMGDGLFANIILDK